MTNDYPEVYIEIVDTSEVVIEDFSQVIPVKGDKGESGAVTTWENLQHKPETFKPDKHTQAIETITDLQDNLDLKADKATTYTKEEIDASLANNSTITDEIARATTAENIIDTKITNHRNDIANPHGTTKAQVGLSNVDNTSDLNKPISNATQTALSTKASVISVSDEVSRATTAENTIDTKVTNHKNDVSNPHGTTKAQVGLSNVDNTTDLSKPVSTATQTALGLKADKSTTYTKTETDTALSTKANTSAIPTKVSQLENDSSYTTLTQVNAKITDIIGTAPANLDTLKELADAINDDASFASTVTTSLAGKASVTSVTNETSRATTAEGTIDTKITNHKNDVANPHGTTKAQVGLSNVDNTSDASKPISTATQTALDLKANKTDLESTVYYNTTNSGTTNTPKWTKMASIELTAQGQSVALSSIRIFRVLAGVIKAESIDVNINLSQDNQLASEPSLNFYLTNKQGGYFEASRIIVTLDENSATKTKVSVYIRAWADYEYFTFTPMLVTNDGSLVTFYNEQPFIQDVSIYRYASSEAINAGTYLLNGSIVIDAYGFTGDGSRLTNLPTYTKTETSNLVAGETTRATTAEGTIDTKITNHKNDVANPHGTTKAQVGLSDVDNTSDLNKPVSTATQTALANKQNSLTASSTLTITPSVTKFNETLTTISAVLNISGSEGNAVTTKSDGVYVPSALKEYTNLASFPATGYSNRLYYAQDSGKTYKWNGSSYVIAISSNDFTDAQKTLLGSVTASLASKTDVTTTSGLQQTVSDMAGDIADTVSRVDAISNADFGSQIYDINNKLNDLELEMFALGVIL